MSKLRIIIADDHSIIRQGIRSLIESEPGWELCGEAADGRAAVALAQEVVPDIALLDITMPELNGIDAARAIRVRCPRTRILVLTMHDSETLAEEVLNAGAQGYVLKSDASEQLPQAIREVAAGKRFLTSRISALQQSALLHGGALPSKDPFSSLKLTPREREIVQLLAEGKTNKQVADALGISTGTVDTHRKNINAKLQFHSTAELVRYAIRNKLTEA